MFFYWMPHWQILTRFQMDYLRRPHRVPKSNLQNSAKILPFDDLWHLRFTSTYAFPTLRALHDFFRKIFKALLHTETMGQIWAENACTENLTNLKVEWLRVGRWVWKWVGWRGGRRASKIAQKNDNQKRAEKNQSEKTAVQKGPKIQRQKEKGL